MGTLSPKIFEWLFRLARPEQWIKNGLVIIPLVFAGEAGSVYKIERIIAAFVIFCLLSSSMYTINDLVDRDKDKIHPLKKSRPIASGKVSPTQAVVFASLLMAAGLAGAWLLGRSFFVIAGTFVLLNLAYSFALKNVVILDAMSIAFSFVLRTFAGAAAIDVVASKWMLINTFLLALFLVFGKRRHELVMLDKIATAHRAILGKYSSYLLDQLIAVTTPSVVVMYMLYSFSSEVSEKLGTENLYLTIPFVVYGIFRYLYLIHKEDKGGSPTTVLFGDRPILFTVILWMITVFVVLYTSPGNLSSPI
ncbi:MAG: decaprenyl-phosphate phosphoribosyltransferase [candidate division Zixibacteria bacterium]|nr:decaprenyl-phosphate phosphoribosyltransferase [candidate division Zixibacteria bacterium]